MNYKNYHCRVGSPLFGIALTELWINFDNKKFYLKKNIFRNTVDAR